MIKLDVNEYCQDCPMFEADVDKRVFIGPEGRRIAETVVCCERADACEQIHEMFEGQMKRREGGREREL